MPYLEPLPDDCPPDESDEVTEARDVFRLVRGNPSTINDFKSQRAEKPNARFHGVTECVTRGLSVLADRGEAENAVKLPNLRGRQICLVRLDVGAGRIQRTGNRPSHHTWWPLAAFDILTHCEMKTP